MRSAVMIGAVEVVVDDVGPDDVLDDVGLDDVGRDDAVDDVGPDDGEDPVLDETASDVPVGGLTRDWSAGACNGSSVGSCPQLARTEAPTAAASATTSEPSQAVPR
jgi:hypothetical protein